MWVTAYSGVPLAGYTPTSDAYNGYNQMVGNSYDGAGNQLSVNGDTATYNAVNRMIQMYEPVNQGIETYVYDGLGELVQKAIPWTQLTVYPYDAFRNLVAAYVPASTLFKEYIYFGGQVVVTQVPVSNSLCDTCYLTYDYLGTVRLITDQNANVVSRHDYLPFGEQVLPGYAGQSSQWNAPDGIRHQFTGQYNDWETGVDFYNARYFSPAFGRFTSADGECGCGSK